MLLLRDEETLPTLRANLHQTSYRPIPRLYHPARENRTTHSLTS